MGPSRVLRALLIGVALAAVAWFALGARQAGDLAAAGAIASRGHHLSADQAAQARDRLSAASQLNPDSNVELVQAQLDRDQSDFRGARRILDKVVASEPDNAAAWYALALSASGSRTAWERSVVNFLRLVPPVHQAR